MPYDNKIELQIAPPTDAQKSAEARHRKFEVRELALAFIARSSPRPRSGPFQPLKPHLKLLIANPELEFLPSHTKRSLLIFSNRKKIAVFDPHFNEPTGQSRAFSRLSPTLTIALAAEEQSVSSLLTATVVLQNLGQLTANTSFTKFLTATKTHISRFTPPKIASHESHAANRQPRTTTRAAFRSTIPARPHAHR